MAETPDAPNSSIVLYTTEDGRARIQCRFDADTVWLTQALMAELFQKDVRTINEHLQNVFAEGELDPSATIRSFRIVRREGTRDVAREIEHYRLEAILAVGYRVRSQRGTQFRQWATARLGEFLKKGFTMDDERLKNPPGPGVPDYFDELLDFGTTSIHTVFDKGAEMAMAKGVEVAASVLVGLAPAAALDAATAKQALGG